MSFLGLHRISNVYSAYAKANVPGVGWVAAVCEPYTGNRLRAAWWVLTGRAYAFQWPQNGDLERALTPHPMTQRDEECKLNSLLDKAESARRWAEGLIMQLPKDHEGRCSWLLNYGVDYEAEKLRLAWVKRHGRSLPVDIPVTFTRANAYE